MEFRDENILMWGTRCMLMILTNMGLGIWPHPLEFNEKQQVDKENYEGNEEDHGRDPFLNEVVQLGQDSSKT